MDTSTANNVRAASAQANSWGCSIMLVLAPSHHGAVLARCYDTLHHLCKLHLCRHPPHSMLSSPWLALDPCTLLCPTAPHHKSAHLVSSHLISSHLVASQDDLQLPTLDLNSRPTSSASQGLEKRKLGIDLDTGESFRQLVGFDSEQLCKQVMSQFGENMLRKEVPGQPRAKKKRDAQIIKVRGKAGDL